MKLLFSGVPGSEQKTIVVDEQPGAMLGRTEGDSQGRLAIAIPHDPTAKTNAWSRRHARFDWDGKEWYITLLSDRETYLVPLGETNCRPKVMRLQQGERLRLAEDSSLRRGNFQIQIRRESTYQTIDVEGPAYQTIDVADGQARAPVEKDLVISIPNHIRVLQGTSLTGAPPRRRIVTLDVAAEMGRTPGEQTKPAGGKPTASVDAKHGDPEQEAARARDGAEAAEEAARDARAHAEDAERHRMVADEALKAVRAAAGMVRVRGTLADARQSAQDTITEASKVRRATDEARTSAQLARQAAQTAADQAQAARRAAERLSEIAPQSPQATQRAMEHAGRARTEAEQAWSSEREAADEEREAAENAASAERLIEEAQREVRARAEADAAQLAQRSQLVATLRTYSLLVLVFLLAVAVGVALPLLGLRHRSISTLAPSAVSANAQEPS